MLIDAQKRALQHKEKPLTTYGKFIANKIEEPAMTSLTNENFHGKRPS